MEWITILDTVFQAPKPYIMKSISYGFIAILLSFFLFSCQETSNNENASTTVIDPTPPNPFLGAWELDRIFNQDTSVNYPGLSIVLFTEGYYSWMDSRPERKSFENISEPTDEEIREAFNTFSALSGPYEFSDSTVTMTRQIVKRPNRMNPPQVDHYAYQVKDGEIHIQSIYRIIEDEKRLSENPYTTVLKKK